MAHSNSSRPVLPIFSAFRSVAVLACLAHLPLTGVLAQVRNADASQPPYGEGVLLRETLTPRTYRENDRGPLERDRRLSHVTLALKRSREQQAALDRLLQDQQNPSSPNYHKWLTPEEFGERFGVSQDRLDRVLDWLRSEGLTVESISHSRSWIVFSGIVTQVETALRTRIHRFEAGGGMHFAPSAPPSVPREIAALIGSIRGLDDFYVEPPRRWRPMLNLTDGTHMLAPADVVTIYQSYGYDGSGQNIAVVGQSDIDPSDIQNFRGLFGLPPGSPQIVLIGDDPGIDQNGGMLEAVADLEWAGGLAPRANLIYVYAKDVFDAVQAAVDQNLAPVISISYGGCEANLPRAVADSIRTIAQQANAQGITLIASSGDAGAATCDAGKASATQGLSVSFPASLPEVTGVGGTQFNEGSGTYWNDSNNPDYSSAQHYIPETAWNDTAQRSVLAASGGGASIFYTKPSWQTAPGVPERDARWVPDISFSASDHDPYVVISGNNVYAFSGTSAGAPVFAGVMALFNQTLALSGPGWPGAGNINPLLYRNAAEQPSAFHDITTGDNIVPCTYGTPDCVNGSLGYSVGPGYDPVTGLGTVNVGELLNLHVSTRTTVTVPASVMVEGQLTVTVTVATQVVPSPNPAGLGQGSVMLYQNGAYKSTANVVGGVTAIPVTLSPGTYTLTATYGGNYSFAASTSAPVTFLVTPNAPAPALLAPANQSAALPDAVQLKWNGASYATSYDVYLGAASPPPFWGSTASFNSTATGMAPSTTYYWRVVANTRNGPVPSPIWSFTTAPRAYTISTLGEVPAPGDVVLDRNGNVYVADQAYCRVRMITPAGIISIVAGSGCLPSNSPDSGDGGPATAASLWSVSGLAIDSQGNFYISSRNRIRKVAPSGVISTFAGSGAFGYSGDGGPPASAELASPTGLAVDGAGNLYIADTANYCVRKISAGIIFTVAGQCGHPGTAGDGHAAIDAELSGPNGLAVDSAGNLYIADTSSIRKVSDGVITTVAGGSAATLRMRTLR